MEFLTGWITNIILFVLLATVIDMLLPSSAMQKYAKMVIGLLLIAIIISPILNLFHTDFDQLLAKATVDFKQGQPNNLENLTEMKKKEIQASQQAYILKQMAADMEADVKEELMDKYEMVMQIEKIELKNGQQPKKTEDVEKIVLSLEQTKKQTDTIEAVEKIEIDTGNSPQPHSDHTDQIKQFLAAAWSVKPEIIEIAGERGGL
ncbi:stage III sporulation protein AF [Peribacillus sp. SCS-155]|uniref:stage III sporulation protein AF n=1 Tax=Peribacillus sedimenti TaxID=3115297 RepID=UPI0039061E44